MARTKKLSRLNETNVTLDSERMNMSRGGSVSMNDLHMYNKPLVQQNNSRNHSRNESGMNSGSNKGSNSPPAMSRYSSTNELLRAPKLNFSKYKAKPQ